MSTPFPRQCPPVFVLSPQVGELGGPAVSTLLLLESLVRSGFEVTLFVTLPPSPAVRRELNTLGLRTICPYFNKGWKYGLPARQIAWRLKLSAIREKPLCIIGMGLVPEALHALRHSVRGLHLWENTDGLPGNKFVDSRFRDQIDRAAGLIAPSAVVEANIRSTYDWERTVRRLPFWCGKPEPQTVRPRSTVRRFLYWGRLDPDKGLLQLVEAFKRIGKTHPQAALTIAGSGSFRQLEDAVKDACNISYLGYVPRTQYEEVLADADVCVLPSLHEGYPLVLLEACARSKPVIASLVGSVPELFEDRPAAVLVPPDDVPALADAIATLLREDASQYHARCADARRVYDEFADLDVIDGKVQALIRDISHRATAER